MADESRDPSSPPAGDDGQGASFTGLIRERTTPPSVRRAEVTAKSLITLGGMGTIAAVLLIFVFLMWVVVPLFGSASVEPLDPVVKDGVTSTSPFVRSGVDGQQQMGWTLRENGLLEVRQLSTGLLLDGRELFERSALPTAYAFSTDKVTDKQKPNCAFGFADGSIRQGRIEFVERYLEGDEVPEEAKKLRRGGAMRHQDGIISITPQDQVRFDRLHVQIEEPVKVADAPIELLDLSLTPNGTAYVYLSEAGKLEITSFQGRFDMMQDAWVFDIVRKPLAYQPKAGEDKPAFLRLSGIGDTVYLIWKNGTLRRFDARATNLQQGRTLDVVEEVDLFDGEEGRTVDQLEFLVGKTTFMVADDQARLHAWFPTRPDGAYPRDGIITARGHVLTPSDGSAARVTAMIPSQRSRLFATAHADGSVRLYHVTTDQLLIEAASTKREELHTLAIAPKEDALVAWTHETIERWRVDPGHPEATFASLFTKVWYEGQTEPEHVWQSEGGSDDFEPKIGLVALIFGTIKATVYSMLIAAPIALLAAIFTSEFLVPRMRAPIKSVVEMMASLPSVVLGFLAAIVLAPFVEDTLIVVLLTFITLPFTIVFGARLWQFLPTRTAILMEGAPRFIAVALTLPISVFIAMLLAPAVEAACFNGDILGWLNRGEGSSTGGWIFLLTPVSMLLVGFVVAWFGGPWLRTISAQWSRMQCALADMARLGIIIVGGILLAMAVGSIFGGFDLRGAEGTALKYQPRNAMIVGFVMGFAIVPIIYTLAEDALSSVPSELREGSLGCGATPWQTAWRIVVPTATSGLFGALMVGLGRAVGETMIVLMAAGNTAILEWNAFSGFRTLSANIATELPEAVKNSTHYRVLFLAGLVLFAMTFVINTVAEMVRRHFRKRFADL